MITKSEYRSFFAQCKPFLRIAYFLKRNGLAASTFSLFMKGSEFDYMISLDRLHMLYNDICNTVAKIA